MSAKKADDKEIDRIAANFVQAYVDDGLDIKAIGRGNAAPNGGDKAYKEMGRFFNAELDSSGLPAIVQESKRAIEGAYGDKPEKLQSKKSGDADLEGQKVDVDLVLIEPYARPILNFVAGPKQSPADSSMTMGVMKTINAIDTRMLTALMTHRDDQLKAAALQRDVPDAATRLAKIREYGWDDTKFQKLVGQGVYSAKDIDKARLNLILNLVCTRCVTPYIMFSGQSVDKDGSPGQMDIAATTKLLSRGVNRLFNKNYSRFGKAIMALSDKGLATDTAKTLEVLRLADRVDSIKQSRHSPSGKDNAYPKRARMSMPNMLQGDQFQAQMREEKKTHEAALQSESQADYEDNRDTEIDAYKRKHAADFENRDFALTFNKLLRTWKRENSNEALGNIAGAMKELHAQARQALRNEAAQPKEVPGKRPASNIKGHAREASATEKTRRESTTADAPGTTAMDLLSEARRATLVDFLKKKAYKTSFERYPELRETMEEAAVIWVKQGIGGNFTLYLKRHYEAELRRSVRVSERAFGSGPKITDDELKKAVHDWRADPDNFEKTMLLDDLRTIMPGSVRTLHGAHLTESSLTRNAEAVTERFLKRTEVKAEFRENETLKKAFLDDIAGWLQAGAHSSDQASKVGSFYETALIAQFHHKRKADGVDSKLLNQMATALDQWRDKNQGKVLSTTVLASLLSQLANDSQ